MSWDHYWWLACTNGFIEHVLGSKMVFGVYQGSIQNIVLGSKMVFGVYQRTYIEYCLGLKKWCLLCTRGLIQNISLGSNMVFGVYQGPLTLCYAEGPLHTVWGYPLTASKNYQTYRIIPRSYYKNVKFSSHITCKFTQENNFIVHTLIKYKKKCFYIYVQDLYHNFNKMNLFSFFFITLLYRLTNIWK